VDALARSVVASSPSSKNNANRAFMVSLLAMLACSGARAPKPATTDSMAVAPPTTDPNAVVPASDPTEGRLRALRDSLVQFPNHLRAPDWLWETGMLMVERFAVIDGSSPSPNSPGSTPRNLPGASPTPPSFTLAITSANW